SAVILQTLNITTWIMKRRCKEILKEKRSKLLTIAQTIVAIIIIIVLIWCINQKYLFLSSVFPIASKWLGISALVMSINMLFCAWKESLAKMIFKNSWLK